MQVSQMYVHQFGGITIVFFSFQRSSKIYANDTVLTDEARIRMFRSYQSSQNKHFVEKLILKLLSCKGVSKNIATLDILRLIFLSSRLFSDQGRMIEIDGPVMICGDIHGQYSDLIRLFSKGGFPPESNYLFLGDYVDRGKNSLEVMLLCLCYKVRYPKNFFMLRGNHECSHINTVYGFKEEIFSRRSNHCELIYDEFTAMMNVMPLSGLVGERILCMHGGISPYLTSLDDLRSCEMPTLANADSLEMDLLWSDPVTNKSGFEPNVRGASVMFGENVVHKICKTLDIDLIVRAHQVVQDGYEFFASRKLITIFSAPHYCGQFNNSAAICVVSEGLEISFLVLKPESLDVLEKSEFRKNSNNNDSTTSSTM